MDLTEADPKGLVRESYNIDGISYGECGQIFIDWVLSLPVVVNTADCLREISRFVPARKKKNSPDQPNDSEQNAVTGEEHRAPAKTWSPLD